MLEEPISLPGSLEIMFTYVIIMLRVTLPDH